MSETHAQRVRVEVSGPYARTCPPTWPPCARPRLLQWVFEDAPCKEAWPVCGAWDKMAAVKLHVGVMCMLQTCTTTKQKNTPLDRYLAAHV